MLILAGAAQAARIVGTAGDDRLVGTTRADTILGQGGRDRLVGAAGTDFLNGGPGSDTVDAGPGADRIAVQYDGERDSVRCGSGADVVNADLVDRVAADCELVGRRLSRDPYTGDEAQHESEVEPDSLTFGRTTVATFQVGRRFAGAADNVGFAVSTDNGSTWRSGLLPGLTRASVPAGPNERASDPVVAYDAVTRRLADRDARARGPDDAPDGQPLGDGFTLERPGDGDRGHGANGITFDKNWIACDNGASSPHRGPLLPRLHRHAPVRPARGDHLERRRGRPGPPRSGSRVTDAVGAFPVIRPSGELVVVYLARQPPRLVVSTDGGLSFGPPTVIAEVQARPARGLRFFPLPSADVDPSGRVWVTWHDCRFSSGCAANSVVVATSTDGRAWTGPTRITSGRHAFLPAIGIHPTTGRVAVVYHVVRPTGGVDVELVESQPVAAGPAARFSRRGACRPRRCVRRGCRHRLRADARRLPLRALAGDRPLAAWVLASEPVGQSLRQAVYATRG